MNLGDKVSLKILNFVSVPKNASLAYGLCNHYKCSEEIKRMSNLMIVRNYLLSDSEKLSLDRRGKSYTIAIAALCAVFCFKAGYLNN
jgi:hypothetical protein